MNLYEVGNGYLGESYVRVYVWCETENKALEMASEKFKQHAEKRPYLNYGKSYWEKSGLKVEFLFSSDSQPFASTPADYGFLLPEPP